MYGSGLYGSDEMMSGYVKFIVGHIPTLCGASVNKKSGFPMKGCYVPVRFEVLEIGSRSVEARITSLGHVKDTTIFMSRWKSPSKILGDIQNKIDLLVNEIVAENDLDRDDIFNQHHPLRNFKWPDKPL